MTARRQGELDPLKQEKRGKELPELRERETAALMPDYAWSRKAGDGNYIVQFQSLLKPLTLGGAKRRLGIARGWCGADVPASDVIVVM